MSENAVDKIYEHFKNKKTENYEEEKHCKMLIEIMMDAQKGTVSAFCIKAMVCERTFQHWISRHELFRNLYYFSKMLAREQWEREGRALRDADYPMGVINYSFEYWKMMGWSRFGISKVSKLKLAIKEGATPAELYNSILLQATEGDFTASEFKQLMEAVNVGINVYQLSELQKQIDELKSGLAVMEQNTNVKNSFAAKGTT